MLPIRLLLMGGSLALPSSLSKAEHYFGIWFTVPELKVFRQSLRYTENLVPNSILVLAIQRIIGHLALCEHD
jgi:hypothetical protein